MTTFNIPQINRNSQQLFFVDTKNHYIKNSNIKYVSCKTSREGKVASGAPHFNDRPTFDSAWTTLIYKIKNLLHPIFKCMGFYYTAKIFYDDKVDHKNSYIEVVVDKENYRKIESLKNDNILKIID